MAAPFAFNDDVYNKIYPGWGRVEAQADWNNVGDQKWGGYQSQNPSPGSSMATAQSAVDTAKALNEFTVQQNQPIIASTEAKRTPINQRYDAVINDIKGNQTTATNRQTTTSRNELGARGIMGGGLFDQTLTDALNPITQSYSNLLTQTEAQRGGELANLDSIIAQLQAGNPSSSVSQAISLLNTQPTPTDIALKEAQTGYYNAMADSKTPITSTNSSLQYQFSGDWEPVG